MKMTPITVDCSIIPPGQSRVPVVDQAMELAKMMELHCAPEEVSELLVSAARTWELTTTFVVKVNSP
jgi:hypothetical protein